MVLNGNGWSGYIYWSENNSECPITGWQDRKATWVRHRWYLVYTSWIFSREFYFQNKVCLIYCSYYHLDNLNQSWHSHYFHSCTQESIKLCYMDERFLLVHCNGYMQLLKIYWYYVKMLICVWKHFQRLEEEADHLISMRYAKCWCGKKQHKWSVPGILDINLFILFFSDVSPSKEKKNFFSLAKCVIEFCKNS